MWNEMQDISRRKNTGQMVDWILSSSNLRLGTEVQTRLELAENLILCKSVLKSQISGSKTKSRLGWRIHSCRQLSSNGYNRYAVLSAKVFTDSSAKGPNRWLRERKGGLLAASRD